MRCKCTSGCAFDDGAGLRRSNFICKPYFDTISESTAEILLVDTWILTINNIGLPFWVRLENFIAIIASFKMATVSHVGCALGWAALIGTVSFIVFKFRLDQIYTSRDIAILDVEIAYLGGYFRCACAEWMHLHFRLEADNTFLFVEVDLSVVKSLCLIVNQYFTNSTIKRQQVRLMSFVHLSIIIWWQIQLRSNFPDERSTAQLWKRPVICWWRLLKGYFNPEKYTT